MHGVDDLGIGDALQVDGGDPEVGNTSISARPIGYLHAAPELLELAGGRLRRHLGDGR